MSTRPQEAVPPAADVLGTIGTIYGASKIWRNYRHKNTDGLPATMAMLWAACGVPFAVYAIVQKFSIALQLQPHCFGGLNLVVWGQCLYYGHKWNKWTAIAAALGATAVYAAVEAILIVTLRIPYYRGVVWPMMMMAIVASVMQALGLMMPFFELAKRQGRVIGIDFWFLIIDWLGAFFSLMALVAQSHFDELGGSMYIVAIALESGILLSHWTWRWRVRHIRREARKLGMTYDEYTEAHPFKKLARSDFSETIVDVEAGDLASPRLPEKCIRRASTDSLAEQSLEARSTGSNTPTENTLSTPEKAAKLESGRG